MNISKSQFVRGLQCVKSLWLYKYKRDIAITPPNTASQNVFDTGTRVGQMAQELFPNGETIPFEGTSFSEKIALTKSLIEQGAETIYEATFDYDGILVMVDILHKKIDGWEIYEVKSSTEVKDVYLQDASVQYYVLNGNGLQINSVNIVHINNKYIRGKELEIDKLFSIVNVTEEVKELQVNIPSYLKHFETVIDTSTEPTIEIGMHCFNPYECDCKSYCWNDVPEYSIFDLANIRKDKALQLYKDGTITFHDIADISVFSVGQQVQILSEQRNSTIIDNSAIQEFLSELTYPIYHLDFETFQQAIPEFEGVSPFQQIPFQYSLHIEHEDGTLGHREFLGEEGKDPREVLALKLVEDIPANVTVLAYNMGFEKGVIRKLSELFPPLGHKLMMIHDNIKDLMTPFQKKHYYVPSMRGSYSIKYVMPALVPEMEQAYKNLDGIHNGGEAMNAYASLHLIEDESERQKIRKSLLEYCKLDTLSMVKVLEKLKENG
jgi:hypothetical protein